MAFVKNPYLTVGELIAKLKEVDSSLPVYVSDEYDSLFYTLLKDKVAVGHYTDPNGRVWADIGIGGCRMEIEY
jgi:hypothetical protein